MARDGRARTAHRPCAAAPERSGCGPQGSLPRGALLAAALSLAAACAPPISVVRLNPQKVHQALEGNAVATGEPSVESRIVLQRRELAERYEDDPAAALAELHGRLVHGDRRSGEVFALAELSFHHAEHGGGRPYYLAAVVYAWAFLFEQGAVATPSAFDPRGRVACDIYNRALAAAFASDERPWEDLSPGPHALPFGSLEVELDQSGLRWGNRRLVRFVAASDLGVIGLRNRYRTPGLGAPLNATTELIDPEQGDFVFPRVKVPVTALLRLEDVRSGLESGRLRGRLEVHAASEAQQVTIDGHPVPLEFEPTSALADALAEAPIWKQELGGFLSGDFMHRERAVRLGSLDPYRPGRIPVVLVHGTASSAGRWAEMINDLSNDARIRKRFQFWAFRYDTGNPIAYSGMLLREALTDAVQRLDPEGRDPCLRQMVVIGHSQGGLLTKLTVIDSGSRFWDNLSSVPLDESGLSPETRDLLRRALFVTPLPFVRRVIFIATPHRGSYRAGGFVRRLVQRFVSMPQDVARMGTDLLTNAPGLKVARAMHRLPTSVDNMSAGNPFIQTLADIPVAPGVASNSIIAVQGDGPVETGVDGVVAYQSAHVDGVESELVVRSGHSTQGTPQTIEEVRRILLVHEAAVVDGDRCRAAPASAGAR